MIDTPAATSPRHILLATGVALASAVVVLVVAVLPAEYGIDPLGTGRVLGLTALAGTEEDPSVSPSTLEAVRVGANTPQIGDLAQDTFTVELRPFEGVEYKYRVERGGSLVYAWTASSNVSYDFHGEPDGTTIALAVALRVFGWLIAVVNETLERDVPVGYGASSARMSSRPRRSARRSSH